jgi:hypothetical protein
MDYLMESFFQLSAEVNLFIIQICIFYLLCFAMLFNFISNYYRKSFVSTNSKGALDSRWALLGVALLIGVPGSIHKAAGQNVYPAFTGYAVPSPAPAAPGDAFAPAMGGGAAGAAPVGAEWTRTAGPDETVLLTGSRLSKYNDDSRGKDTRFMLYDGTAALKEASVQRVDTNKAVFTLPASAAQWGMYLVWPGNEDGYGQPIALNQTALYQYTVATWRTTTTR